MLELRVAFDGARAEAHAYLEAEDGSPTLLPLPLRSGQLVKRLLYVERAATLRLLPVAAPRAFELRHFRLARLPARFARSRIERKLSAKHPRYMRQTTHGRLGKNVPNDARALWAEYNRLFERSSELVSYDEWIEAVERHACPSPSEQAFAIAAWEHRPTFSIIMPIADTDEGPLRECLDSVLSQTYPHWELCIAETAVRRILLDYAARDPRIRLDTPLSLARGDYVTFLDPNDVLAPHAFFAVARALQQRPSAELVYSDEDKLDELGGRCDPYFKPDYAPDLLYAQNYIAHLAVYRRKLVDAAGGFRPGYEGSQDYDLLLRCIGRIGDARDILHVPEVLYHWRRTAGSSATSQQNAAHAAESARRALEGHLHLAHPEVRVSITAPGLYRVHWPLPEPAPLVTLIVPTRDGHDVLKKCVDSIRERTTYPNYEILLVDNDSRCLKTRSHLEAFAEQGVRVLRYDAPFNFSAINNFAVREARGTVLGLINDDVEVINDGWLTELVSHALRPEIGCVGAKLYYPDDTIQHAGVVLGIGGIAGHSHKYLDRNHDGYFGRLRIAHNVSAVTAAALVVRRQVWDEVGGLDERELSVAFNDVDFCLRVMAAGYRNLWTPHAELYHYESKSRGSDETPEKAARFRAEREVMLRRWGPLLERDPYYSPHLSLVREDFSRALPEALHVSAWGRGAA
jgi:GT2 family glycosyltransferase